LARVRNSERAPEGYDPPEARKSRKEEGAENASELLSIRGKQGFRVERSTLRKKPYQGKVV